MSDPVHLLVEIPKGSRNKYEWDEELQAIKLDRFLFSSVVYPTDYGFIPETDGEDGDPLDAMCLVSEATFPGCVIPVKVIGLFKMLDDGEVDDKILCVPMQDPNWADVDTLDDISDQLKSEISHFFAIYKGPEGKVVEVDGWYAREDALQSIAEARDRYRERTGKGAVGADAYVAFRTPDDRFAALPDWEHEPAYLEHDGLRIAYVDAGPADGPVVWLQHGEPTWSFLWRKVVAPLTDAGFRCVVPDLVGFGRSDKPERLEDYSFDAHVAWMAALVEHLDVRDAALVVHDWGGPIGMRLFVEHPERFARIAILDTGFFTGEQRMTDAWKAFRDFVERTEDLPVGFLVNGGCATELAPGVVAAYEAPFPTPGSKAGARAFPLILPTTPDMPAAAAGRAVRDAMVADGRPKLLLWADGDPIIPLAAGEKMAELLGAPLEVVPDASHFLQEDNGAFIGERLASWLRG